MPKRTNSKTQPLDAGIIACIKRRYRRRQISYADDYLEKKNVNELYNLDVLKAIETIYSIWENLESEVIYNCWLKTQLVQEYEKCTP